MQRLYLFEIEIIKNKKIKRIAIISTDLELTEEDVIAMYGKR